MMRGNPAALGICRALLVMLACAAATVTTAATATSAGAVAFSAANYGVQVGAGAVLVTVDRAGGSSGDAIATYMTIDGSAIAGIDYTATSGTVTWSDGDAAPKSFIVPITPGGTGRSFTVALISATRASFGDPISATVSIGAPPVFTTTAAAAGGAGAVAFSAANYGVEVGTGAALVTVDRVGGSSGDAIATYTTIDGSAIAGTDYTATSGTVSWSDGDAAPKSFMVPVTPGGAGRSFTVTLLSATRASFGNPIDATVSISAPAVATTSPGAVAFSAASYSVGVGDGVAVVTVDRVGGSSGDVIASYTTIDGSAVAGTDYTATSGTVSWSDGDATPKSFVVPITPGGAGTRSFTVSLISATGALFGDPINATVLLDASAGAGSGTATLSWLAPTENTDGSALIDLAGYNIYYGTSVTAMTHKISITTVGLASFVISDLSSGTWYFAVTSIDAAGVESAFSDVVSKSL